PQFGAGRTIGFGKLLKIEIKPETRSRVSSHSEPATGNDAFDLVIRPQSSFCFAGHRQVANLFESSIVIPGAGIKGALVESWAAIAGAPPGANVGQVKQMDGTRRKLAEHFDKLVFSHALPGKGGVRVRSVEAPLSIIKLAGEKDWFDLALIGKPVL